MPERRRKLTAPLHAKLFAAEDVMQQALHAERTQAHQTLRRLLSYRHVTVFVIRTVQVSVRACSQLCVSTVCVPTGAVEAASQLSGHHLHDESDPEPEHVPEQSRLGAHVHG